MIETSRKQRFSAADIKRARNILRRPSNRVPWLYLGYLVCVAVLAFAGGWMLSWWLEWL